MVKKARNLRARVYKYRKERERRGWGGETDLAGRRSLQVRGDVRFDHAALQRTAARYEHAATRWNDGGVRVARRWCAGGVMM